MHKVLRAAVSVLAVSSLLCVTTPAGLFFSISALFASFWAFSSTWPVWQSETSPGALELVAFPCLATVGVGIRTGGSCALLVPRPANRTASSWSSLSWLDNVGRDTRKCVLSFTALARRGEGWITDHTSFNSDYRRDVELFNTLFNTNISLIYHSSFNLGLKKVVIAINKHYVTIQHCLQHK